MREMTKKNITPMFILFFLSINIAGLVNKEIQNKLKPYVPIIDVILKISKCLKKLYETKFQGNPVKIEPLTYSKTPKINEKIKNELINFFCLKITKR